MTSDLQPGSSFGEYVLEKRLGAGGFGAVWLAHDSGGSHVAVKILQGQYASAENAKVRAEIELLAGAASSRSSHIAQVLGGGSDPQPYVVMEYIEGTDLAHEIEARGTLPVPEVLDIAEAIADALGALQRAGIIHRDIKPGNVMIDTQGVVKLTDFGIAKIIGIDTVTATGQASMSMPYAAPEVWEGKATNISDHYAFGALLYQCLAGRVPFAGSYVEIYHQHLNMTPDLNALPADTPPSLRNLISACLEKDPARRPQDSRALLSAIASAKAELASPPGTTGVRPLLQEPRQIGPWSIEARSQDEAWLFLCRNESTGEEADVEIRFSDDLNQGNQLRQQYPGRSSRLVLRPGEGWSDAPPSEFLFWVARTTAGAAAVSDPGQPPVPAAESLATSVAPIATSSGPAPAPVPQQPLTPRQPPTPPGPPVDGKPVLGASGGQGSPSTAMKAGAALAALVVILGVAFALGVFGGKSKKPDTSVLRTDPPATTSSPPAQSASTPVAQPTTAPGAGSGSAAQPTATTSAPPSTQGQPGSGAAAGGTSNGGAITVDGPTVTASTTMPGQKVRYTFSGASGQVISVLITKVSKTLTTPCAYIGIVNDTETSLGRVLVCTENAFLDQVKLPTAGTYTLAWEPLDKGMGDATFKLLKVVDITGEIAVDGAAVTANVTTPGQNAEYTFSGAAGQVVSVVATKVSKSLTTGCAYVTIVNALDTSLGRTLICSETGFQDQVMLSTAGTYTLTLDPVDVGVGQATLTLFNVADIKGTVAVDGAAVTANIATPGQNARYTFTGTNGQVVSVAASKLSTTLASACGYISIVNNLDTSLGRALACGDQSLEKVTLPSAGTYTLVFDPVDLGTGQVTLNLTTAK